MFNLLKHFKAPIILATLPLLAACDENGKNVCLISENLNTRAPTQQFVAEDILFTAAVIPGGGSTISVMDYTSPIPDGKNEIHVPWSSSDTGGSEYAKITFPTETFPNGIRNLKISAFHYQELGYWAMALDGTVYDIVEAPPPPAGTVETLVSGTNITNIRLKGSEIGITRICYTVE